MKCTKCGTENPKGKNVCKKCGAFLYSYNPNNRVPLTPEQKKARRKAMFTGSIKGCLWSFLIIIGMFILLGVLSYLLVRFVIPDDFFATTETGTTTATDELTSETSLDAAAQITQS